MHSIPCLRFSLSHAPSTHNSGIEILPLLVDVLERPFQNIERAVWTALQEKANVPGSLERAVAMAVTRDQKLAVQKATKVLAMYSLVPEAKRPMCQCEGMLRWLTRIIDTHNYNRVKPGAPVIGGMASAVNGGTTESVTEGDESDDKLRRAKRLELATRVTSGAGLYMTEAARFNTIATLTNLAAHEANRMPMLREPGLLDNICRVVHNERSDVPKQCSALAIMVSLCKILRHGFHVSIDSLCWSLMFAPIASHHFFFTEFEQRGHGSRARDGEKRFGIGNPFEIDEGG